jgi:hypothetical protein
MPTVTHADVRSAAGAARVEACALRAESRERRRRMRKSAHALARRVLTSKAAFSGLDGGLDGRGLHFRSAWSDLLWSPPDAELDRVLVSHDGEM